jgi:hypothetical protein
VRRAFHAAEPCHLSVDTREPLPLNLYREKWWWTSIFKILFFLDNLGEGRMDPRVFKKLRFSKAKFYPMSYDFR